MTRVFFDMDGVLAEYKETDMEQLLSKGYFEDLKPQEEAIKAIKALACNPDYEVYTLSAVLRESEYAYDEKVSWLKRYLGGENIKSIFIYCGENKADAVPGGIRETDILIDDYNVNLRDWAQSAVAIKFLNGINHKHKSWTGKTADNNAASVLNAVYNSAIAV